MRWPTPARSCVAVLAQVGDQLRAAAVASSPGRGQSSAQSSLLSSRRSSSSLPVEPLGHGHCGPRPGSETMSNSSISRRAPGRPRPRPSYGAVAVLEGLRRRRGCRGRCPGPRRGHPGCGWSQQLDRHSPLAGEPDDVAGDLGDRGREQGEVGAREPGARRQLAGGLAGRDDVGVAVIGTWTSSSRTGRGRAGARLSRAQRSHSRRCRAASSSRWRRRSALERASSTGRHWSVGGSSSRGPEGTRPAAGRASA